MAATKTWDLKEQKTIIGPYALKGEAEDGDVVIVARDEQTFTKGVGATGEVARSKTNNRAGTITIRLMQTSEMNTSMSTIMASDELANSGIVPFTSIDNAGFDVHIAPEIWLQKPPDGVYGKAAGTREWIFDAADLDMFFGGN